MPLSAQRERGWWREEEKQGEQEQEEAGEKVGILYNEVKVVIGEKQEHSQYLHV